MEKRTYTYPLTVLLFLVLSFTGNMETYAQNALQRRQGVSRDSLIEQRNREQLRELEAPIDTTRLLVAQDSSQQKLTIHKERFIPNPNRAVWLALVIPGGGQIYNRKYWKLPLVYGGFVGCAYALNWNSQMYKDYSQAYLDIMDDDPNTKSFEDFLPPSANITGQESRYRKSA